jgi:hypothetical protein
MKKKVICIIFVAAIAVAAVWTMTAVDASATECEPTTVFF